MAVECARCNAPNPKNKRFCGECGAPLGPNSEKAASYISSTVRDQLEEILTKRYKEQKLVELETTQAIAARLSEWAKLFAFFVGIPVACLLVLLSVFGIKTYSDVSKQVEVTQKQISTGLKEAQESVSTSLKDAQDKVSTSLRDAQEKAAKLKADGETITAEYQGLRNQLAAATALADNVKKLSEKVDVIEEKLKFTDSSNLPPDVIGRLRAEFDRYEKYLKDIGFQPKGPLPMVDVVPAKDLPSQRGIAYFDEAQRKIVLSSVVATEPIFICSTYMPQIIFMNYPAGVSHGRYWLHQAIAEGLSRYFPASFLNNPVPSAKSPQVSVARKRSFKGVRQEQLRRDADVVFDFWSNAFWELRQILGQATTDKLLFQAWTQLTFEDVEQDRGISFVRRLIDLDKGHEQEIRKVFVERDLMP